VEAVMSIANDITKKSGRTVWWAGYLAMSAVFISGGLGFIFLLVFTAA
jgi:hypothetical protein